MSATIIKHRFRETAAPQGEVGAVPLAFERGHVVVRRGSRGVVEVFVTGAQPFMFFLEKEDARAFGAALIKLGE